LKGSLPDPKGPVLAPEEVEVLKKVNGGDAPWKEMRAPVGSAWECEAKKLRAYLRGNRLIVGTVEYLDGEQERAKAKRIENLKDF
jgi:hypothetical protein